MIADLSVNHVERHALLCGFAVQRIAQDYGIDLWIATFDRSGELQNGQVRLQLKATDHLKVTADGRFVLFRVARKDLHDWLLELMPVILVVYDAQGDLAYWLYVQAHFEKLPDFDVNAAGAQLTVRIPRTNIVDQAAMRKFAEYRDAVLTQTEGVVHHD
jgi:hypothetical protein